MRADPGSARTEVTHVVGDAFADFYALEHDGQVRRAFLLLGEAGHAHDVVADAFVAVYQRWDTIDEPGPYLNRCVLNGCRDKHRRSAREQPVDNLQPEPGDVDPTDEIAELLLGLPFRQRAAVVLRFYGGFSDSAIAQYLDCRPGTVGSLIHRALRRLRHLLASENRND